MILFGPEPAYSRFEVLMDDWVLLGLSYDEWCAQNGKRSAQAFWEQHSNYARQNVEGVIAKTRATLTEEAREKSYMIAFADELRRLVKDG